MKTKTITLTIILFALLLSACADNNAVNAVDLEGQTWVLVSLNGVDPLGDRRPTLEFEAGQVSGNTGCNHYGGSYQIDGDSIQFTDLFNTEMACLDPEGIMQQEQAYLELLRVVERFERLENTLTFFTAAGQTLIFSNQPEAMVANTIAPTPEPDAPTQSPTPIPTQTPEVIVPTPTDALFEPPTGFKEYLDPVGEISIYIPENWAVTSVILGQSAILQSYPEDKYIGGEAFAPGDTKCDLNIHPKGESAADLVAQWRADAMTTIVSEAEFNSQTGLAGQRFVLDSMGRATVFLFEINQRVVLLTCFGDFLPVDEIAATLQALE
jgi:heat shock protein HslJ